MAEPFMSGFMDVKPEWIDYNGHLNMAYYSVLFDQGVDAAWERFGLGGAYSKATGLTTYSAEFHICYLRELHLGDRVRASYQVVDHDEKRIHSFQKLIHEDGWVAATGENIHLSIDQSGPHVAPFPADVQARIAAMAQEHQALPRPDRVGRSIGISRKPA